MRQPLLHCCDITGLQIHLSDDATPILRHSYRVGRALNGPENLSRPDPRELRPEPDLTHQHNSQPEKIRREQRAPS